MLVDCPDCGRSYRLEAADLGPRGRVVICPRCDARWFQRAAQDRRVEAASWSRVRTSEQPLPPTRRAAAHSAAADPAALAAGRPAPSGKAVRRLRLAAAALASVGIVAGGIGARAAVVRTVPRTAFFYAAIGWPVNLRGLRFAGVAPSRAEGSPADVVVAGTIRNVTHTGIALPRLVFEVRDAGGATLARWSESPPSAALPAGRTLRFLSRPQRMPAEGRSVLVRFEDPLPDDVAAPRRVASR